MKELGIGNKTFSKEELSDQNWKVAKKKSDKGAADMEKVWSGEREREEDKEICTECKEKVKSSQMGIICDYCQIWFHNDCVRIDKNEC